MKKIIIGLLGFILVLFIAGCKPPPTGTDRLTDTGHEALLYCIGNCGKGTPIVNRMTCDAIRNRLKGFSYKALSYCHMGKDFYIAFYGEDSDYADIVAVYNKAKADYNNGRRSIYKPIELR